MTRDEYNDFRYTRKQLRQFKPSYGTCCSIPVDASVDYKLRLHDLYMGLGMHPASVRVDTYMFDDRERIIYIFGQTHDVNGMQISWFDLYTKAEHARFLDALYQ